MDKLLTHDFGKSFPPALSFGGYVFIIVGLLALPYNIFLGLLFSFLGIFVAFTRSGIQINLMNKTYRSYNYLFGLKQGKWLTLENYSKITLLRNKEQSATLSASNRRAETPIDIYYDIYILSENQLHKRCIKRIKDKDIAITDLKNLSQLLNIPIVKYQPGISRQSRNKKYRS